MTLKEFLEAIQRTIENLPDSENLEVVYSADDEGNEYLKVNFTPTLCKVENIDEDRFLEITFPNNVTPGRDQVNAIMIN